MSAISAAKAMMAGAAKASKVVKPGILDSKFLSPLTIAFTSPRGLTLMGSALGYGIGKEVLRVQESKLRAYYGDEKYESKYQRGIGMFRTGISLAGAYGVASAIFGKTRRDGYATGTFTPFLGGTIGKVAKGASWPARALASGAYGGAARLGRNFAKARAARGASIQARRAVVDKVSWYEAHKARTPSLAYTFTGSPDMVPSEIAKLRKSAKAARGKYTRSRSAVGGAIYGLMTDTRDTARLLRRKIAKRIAVRKTAREVARANRPYRQNYPRPPRPMRREMRKELWSKRRKAIGRGLDVANWRPGTLFKTGTGLTIGAGIAGGFYGRTRKPYPIMESGNLTMARPTINRMNFSTAGLTQALHDRSRRML